jgi:hypothetical protein
MERREVDISVHAGGECTVIRFISISAKFAICTVVDLNGTLVEAKIRVPVRPTTLQMPNLALTETKRITVHGDWGGAGEGSD